MKNKRNVFLVGPMGAGKTTIGKQLSDILKLDFVDTDQVIESRTGAAIDWIFDLEGEEGFRDREQKIIEELTGMQGIILATGGGAVNRKENRILLAGRGVVVYLEASIEQQMERTRKDKRRPLLRNNDPENTLLNLMDERDPLYREIADYVVATNDNTVKSVANQIADLILEN